MGEQQVREPEGPSPEHLPAWGSGISAHGGDSGLWA